MDNDFFDDPLWQGQYGYFIDVWEDLTKPAGDWIIYWEDKVDEPDLLAVACGTKSSRRNTFV